MTLTTLTIKMQFVVKKKKENTFVRNRKYGLFSLRFVIKPGGGMTEIFSVGLKKIDRVLKAYSLARN